jgi:protein TonB
MNSAESILPVLRLPRPTLTAWVLSALVHITLLAGSGALPFSAAQPGAFREMEVTLMMSGAAPALARSRVPATVMTTAASAHTPIASSVADENASSEPHDEPLVESRYNVAALNNPKPPYPLAARRQGTEGRVVLRAQVLEDGHCTEVRIVRSSGHALLDESALATVRRWNFVPATRAGKAVSSWVEVPIYFQLNRETRL